MRCGQCQSELFTVCRGLVSCARCGQRMDLVDMMDMMDVMDAATTTSTQTNFSPHAGRHPQPRKPRVSFPMTHQPAGGSPESCSAARGPLSERLKGASALPTA